MKKIFKYITVLTLMISLWGLSSCDEFLTEESISTTTADALYGSADGMESLISACYAPSRKWYGKMTGYLLTEAGTDEILMGGWGAGYAQYHVYNKTLQGSEAALTHIWTALYKGINACNAAIGRMEISELSESTKIIRLGEVHFLRAFYYYHLVETFGAIPIRTTETQAPELTAQRKSVEDVYKLIFEDLTVALTNLSTITTPQGGRVTKPAVEAFLARLYLTRGMNTEALNTAKKLISGYNFELNDDCTTMWKMENADANQNKEAIWFVNYCADNNLNDVPKTDALGYLWLWEGGHHGHAFFCMMNFGLPGFTWDIENGRPLNQYLPSKFLLNLYNETIDSRYKGTFRTAWWANDAPTLPASVNMGDTILVATKKVITQAYRQSKKYTIYDLNDVYNTDGSVKGDRSRYVQMNKFADPTRSDRGVHESKRDAIVFRLAEMYMIAAEASMNLGDKTAAANYINVVRERAAYPGKEAQMRITAADVTLDFILDERAREFVGEQQRWFDLKRTGKLIERLNKYNVEAAVNVKEYHLLRPIPQVEIDVIQNKDEFKQNPGYN